MARKTERVFPKSEMPEGYRRTAGNFPQIHDFKKEPILTGIVQEIKTVAMKMRGKASETRIMSVAQHETGEISAVWESAALQGLFDEAKKGDDVFIKFTGMIRVKGRAQPMKGFDAGIKE